MGGSSKFGFSQLAKGIEIATKEFLVQGIELAKKDFDSNFQKEEDPGDDENAGGVWEPLKYRREPPPILQLTGNMRQQTTQSGNVVYGGNFATFTIDPKDKRGRGYAAYHHEGTTRMSARRTVVQSRNLDFQQLNLLKNLVDKVFDKQGTFT